MYDSEVSTYDPDLNIRTCLRAAINIRPVRYVNGAVRSVRRTTSRILLTLRIEKAVISPDTFVSTEVEWQSTLLVVTLSIGFSAVRRPNKGQSILHGVSELPRPGRPRMK